MNLTFSLVAPRTQGEFRSLADFVRDLIQENIDLRSELAESNRRLDELIEERHPVKSS